MERGRKREREETWLSELLRERNARDRDAPERGPRKCGTADGGGKERSRKERRKQDDETSGVRGRETGK